jgi:hypothetical protein
MSLRWNLNTAQVNNLIIVYSRAVVRTSEAEGIRYEWLMPKEEGLEATRQSLAGTPEQRPKLSFLTLSASSLFPQCFLQLALSFVDACSYRWLLFPTTCFVFCRCLFSQMNWWLLVKPAHFLFVDACFIWWFLCQTPNIWVSRLCHTHHQTHFGLL